MKKNSLPLALSLCSVAFSLCVATQAHAQLLTNEAFTGYPNANTNIVGQNGGTGWSGAWNSGQADGFLHTVRTPTAIVYTGYNGTSTPAASGGNFLNLAAGFNGANPAAVFRGLDVSAGGVYATNGYLSGGVIGADNTTLWGSFLYSNSDVNPGNSTKTFTLSGGGSFSTGLPQTAASNLLVFRIDFRPGATDTVTLFSNPTLATFDGTTGGATSAAGNYSFSALTFTELATGVTAGSGTEGQYDDIRFGRTLADVVPGAVPEPSTYALALGGLGLLLGVQRFRRGRVNV